MVSTQEEILKHPEADLITNHIVDRYKKGLYSLVLVHGLPGTGKSSTCFRVSEIISNHEYMQGKQVIFKVITTLKDIAEFAINSQAENLNIGVVEEASVLFPSRRAMSGENVDVARIMDTCRKKKIILLTNAPIWTSIDSHIRAMGNVYIETLKIYKTAKIVVSKMYRLQTNPGSGKTYTHCFQRKGRDVKRMYTKMPNLELWAKYEQDKDKFMLNLYQRIKARAEKREAKENKELGIIQKRTADKPLTKKELEAYDLAIIKGLGVSETARRLGVSHVSIHQRLANLTKKTHITYGELRSRTTKANAEGNKVNLELQDDNSIAG